MKARTSFWSNADTGLGCSVPNLAKRNANFGCFKLMGVFHTLHNLIAINIDRVGHIWSTAFLDCFDLSHLCLSLLIDLASPEVM